MKRRSFTALTALGGLVTLPRAAGAEDSAVGSHGMAVFGGREGLYASHLPMFHAPHDTQLVFRFHLADATADRALRDTLAREPRLWTLDPERFDLLRFAPGHGQPLREFTATFFEGHFERGGRPQPREQRVVVGHLVRFHRLNPAPHTATVARYQLIGGSAEGFAFKHIDRRPTSTTSSASTPPPSAVRWRSRCAASRGPARRCSVRSRRAG